MRTHVVDRKNIRMIECAGGGSLLLKTMQSFRIIGIC